MAAEAYDCEVGRWAGGGGGIRSGSCHRKGIGRAGGQATHRLVCVGQAVAVHLAVALAVAADGFVQEVVGAVAGVGGPSVVRLVQAHGLFVGWHAEQAHLLQQEPEGDHVGQHPACRVLKLAG